MREKTNQFKAKVPGAQGTDAADTTRLKSNCNHIVTNMMNGCNYHDSYDNQIEYLQIMGRVIELQIEELRLIKALDELEVML